MHIATCRLLTFFSTNMRNTVSKAHWTKTSGGTYRVDGKGEQKHHPQNVRNQIRAVGCLCVASDCDPRSGRQQVDPARRSFAVDHTSQPTVVVNEWHLRQLRLEPFDREDACMQVYNVCETTEVRNIRMRGHQTTKSSPSSARCCTHCVASQSQVHRRCADVPAPVFPP